jgi:hypothetical protein
MGQWNITIRGTGCHHNGSKTIDADLAAAEFVAKLKAMGATITSASITFGGDNDLGDPEAYIRAFAKDPDPHAKE